MNKLYLSALALLGSAAPLLAQNRLNPEATIEAITPNSRACATMEVLEAQLAANPGLARSMEAIEAHTRQYLAQPKMMQRSTAATVVTIPVVVHVVYNTTAQNISNALITAQIKTLNDDYAKLNSDTKLVPGAFTGVAAATNVRFVLATVDPAGNPTSGIVRRSTKTHAFSSNDAVKYTSRGGDDAWPSDKYLNLWFCNLGQSLLGYAQFPGGPAATDGVVCLYSSVTGGTANNYNKGRTATHEVGHWLNLRHIWGDATCGDDLVADTPTQQTSNGGCPAFPHITCSNQGDMSMNYMDYTYDQCMYMFTAGQSARMDALFTAGGARFSLTTSPAALRQAPATATSVSVYPNPALESLTLSMPAGADAAQYAVRVYDMRGHEMTAARYDGHGQVELSNLPKGLYYVTIANGTETTRQRFEKQ
ncbi:M43 family zinc metalloprotease [Hymenobacter sp. BT770]|uniref:M43 family zinc metalloprotease n=1 Tax=Hymenobacter sp. BT770 TaxID=2886942 RepID=UPI001D1100DD|nr:M43 family zinc metalloprotease [Hymenobacter sp. BT770]MCC3153282.1 T9SS type A sorting domain-containing protein [Hymenobacter sp. BT770]MDO3414277.1 M43 family zinc metalloprotease [Hymenobacter sp. BT770]